MPGNVDAEDLRALLALSNELHALPPEPSWRKRHMLRRLSTLLNAKSGFTIVAQPSPEDGSIHVISRVDAEPDAAHAQPASSREFIPQAVVKALDDAHAPQSKPAHASRPPIERKWEWGTAWVCHDPDAIEHCIRPLADRQTAPVVACVRFDALEANFGDRESRLLDAFHSQAGWLYQLDMLMASPEAIALSKRERETLNFLLVGYSEKQIGNAMRLSTNTIHHYVKSLYRHFGVSSRSELLARWVGQSTL